MKDGKKDSHLKAERVAKYSNKQGIDSFDLKSGFLGHEKQESDNDETDRGNKSE